MQTRTILLCCVVGSLLGCGVKAISGGTKGTLLLGGRAASIDIQVTVHQVEAGSTRPLGFGTTKSDGSFELVTNGAKGPLWLAPGEYRVTLESVGAPVVFPKELAQAETTPLKVPWSKSDKILELKVE